MKLKNILAMAVLAIGAIVTSCSDEGYWEPYVQEGQAQYSFAAKNSKYSFGYDEKPAALYVTVQRGSTEGEATIPVVTKFSDPALSGASEVKFNAGESTATYQISLDENISAGNYTASIALADSSYLSVSGNFSSTVNLTIEFVWEPFAVGSFIDGWMGVVNENVEIQKAAGADVYRIFKPFWNQSIEAWWEEELPDAVKAEWTADMIEISIDENGLIYYTPFAYGPYDLDAGDWVYGYHPSDYSASYDEQYSPMNGVASETQIQFVPIMYVPDLGSFGPKQFILDITGSGKTF